MVRWSADVRIVRVRTSSNDPELFHEAMEWVRRERPELIAEPCRGFFKGGPTPGQCVRAMVRRLAELAGCSVREISRRLPERAWNYEA